MIEFFFDCSSPWTYLAFHNIQLLAREFDEEISWRPIPVGGIFSRIFTEALRPRENPGPRPNRRRKDMRRLRAQTTVLTPRPRVSVSTRWR